MKRTVPLLITALAGFVLILSFFVPAYQKWGEIAAVWFDILAAIAFVLGGGNLVMLQLKKISDRSPGWGYAAVTLASFVITLALGLLKFGVSPAPNTEFYGETFVNLPVSELPEYAVPGELATRADGRPLPASVRGQIRQQGGQVFFRGWMLENQRADLLDFQDDLKWRATVEELHAAAQPPEELGNVTYYPSHGVLSFTGSMSAPQRTALESLFANSVTGKAAVAKLFDATQVIRSLTATEGVTATPEDLRFTGPMTNNERERLEALAPGSKPVRPLDVTARITFLMQIESRSGRPLNRSQLDEYVALLNAEWQPQALIDVLNAAGVAQPQPKTYRELYAEQEAAVNPLERNHPVPQSIALNEAQRTLVFRFASDPAMTPQALLTQLREAGPLTDDMADAIEPFLEKQQTQVERKHSLWRALIRTGPLTRSQADFLLEDYRQAHAWKNVVAAAFLQSQQVKYAWSGDYTEEGRPFWWLVEYIFTPLLQTTFALLAFYVASAAFRAFRAKNVEAVLLLGTAFIILLGRTFAGYLLTAWVPESLSALKIDQLSVYIMSIVNTGGNRAILIGVALGIASTSLKVLLGIDRSYLGSGDD